MLCPYILIIKQVWLSFSTLFTVYATVAVLSYLACGENTPGDLLLVLPHDWRKSAAGVLMVIHHMVTYTISQQVLSRAICAYLLPEALQDGIVARFKWFFVTSAMMAACFLVANLIPLFQERSCEMNVWKLKLPTSTGASFGLTIP